jgi:hypothetical protein
MDPISGNTYRVITESVMPIDLSLDPSNTSVMMRVDVAKDCGNGGDNTMECLAFGYFADRTFVLTELQQIRPLRNGRKTPMLEPLNDKVAGYLVASAITDFARPGTLTGPPEDEPIGG